MYKLSRSQGDHLLRQCTYASKVLYPDGKLASGHAAAQQKRLLKHKDCYPALVRTFPPLDCYAILAWMLILKKRWKLSLLKRVKLTQKLGRMICMNGSQMLSLVALSHGECQLTLKRWQESRKLETLRKQRVSAVTPPKRAKRSTAVGGGPPPAGFGIIPGSKRTTAPQ